MKRGITILLASTLLTGLSSMVGRAAPAAFGRVAVVSCRAANPQCWPTSFAFAPDGTIWYVERFTGQIRFFNPKTKKDSLWTTIGSLSTDGEQGLLGITLDPAWATSPWVYVYYTKSTPSGPVNRIVRLLRHPGGGFSLQQLLLVPAGTDHNGGKLHFGPDGNLWAVSGETGNPALAQDKSSMGGKVLHITKSGGIPSGNPFHNAVFSFGHRNSFGLAFDPVTHDLWQTENGPECNDEINHIVRGGNYAWGPNEYCPGHTNNSGPLPRMYPAWLYDPTIAPTGAAFCSSCGLGSLVEGNLLFGSWNDSDVRALKLNADRKGIVSSTVLYTHSGGILDMEAGPAGLYFSAQEGIYRLVKA
jgi:glucose/arabinose dehydrogenase